MLIVTGWGLVAHPLKLTAKARGKSRIKGRSGAGCSLDNIDGPFSLGADCDLRTDHAFRNLAGLLIEGRLLFSGDYAGVCIGERLAGPPNVGPAREDSRDDQPGEDQADLRNHAIPGL
jgi:hypothetical protein